MSEYKLYNSDLRRVYLDFYIEIEKKREKEIKKKSKSLSGLAVAGHLVT